MLERRGMGESCLDGAFRMSARAIAPAPRDQRLAWALRDVFDKGSVRYGRRAIVRVPRAQRLV